MENILYFLEHSLGIFLEDKYTSLEDFAKDYAKLISKDEKALIKFAKLVNSTLAKSRKIDDESLYSCIDIENPLSKAIVQAIYKERNIEFTD